MSCDQSKQNKNHRKFSGELVTANNICNYHTSTDLIGIPLHS